MTQMDPSQRIVPVANLFSLRCETSLEEYRATTFFSKEPETVAWIADCLKNGGCFIDVGANVGIYTLYAASLYPDRPVYALEPFGINFQRLLGNIALNNAKNVVPVYGAAGAHSRIETLYIPDLRPGGSGSQVGTSLDEHGNPMNVLAQQPVLVFSIDDFCALFGIHEKLHIKIDVDGLEDAVIQGMCSVLKERMVESVLVEINRESSDLSAIERTLAAHGLSSENQYNQLPNHSRYRRAGTKSASAENVIFTSQK